MRTFSSRKWRSTFSDDDNQHAMFLDFLVTVVDCGSSRLL